MSHFNKCLMKSLAYYFLCVLVSVGYINCQTFDDVFRLKKYLFDGSRYDKGIRPVLNQSTVIQVQFLQAITNFVSLDITYGKATVLSNCPMFWFDELLTWNSTEFGGIKRLVVTHDQIWYPVIYILNAVSNDNAVLAGDVTSVSVTNNGMVTMLQGGVLETTCETDAFVYPFDSHVCDFRFISVHELTAELVMVPFATEVDTTDMIENKEWILTSSLISQYNLTEISGAWHTSGIQTRLVITRRPMLTVLRNLPLYMLMIISTLSSFVPISSGERLSFSVTVFLSFLFLGSSMLDTLPRDAMKISLSSYLMFFGNMICSIGVVWSVFIVKVSTLSTERNDIHAILMRITLFMRKKRSSESVKKNQKAKRLQNKVFVTDVNNHIKDDKYKNIATDTHIDNKPIDYKRNNDDSETRFVDWAEVAEALDRIYFYILLSIALTVIVGFCIVWFTYSSP